MAKLLMVDYYGMCNEQGQTIGHSVKVLHEYSEMVEGAMEVSVAASPCIIREADRAHFQNLYPLKYDISLGKDNSLTKRIRDKVKLLTNLRQVSRIEGCDFIWFYRTDFFLFLFLFLHLFSLCNMETKIVLVYQDDFGNKVLNYVFRKVIKKFDLVITTTSNSNISHKNIFKMPDYLYDEAKYAPYIKAVKKDKVVCVGTMNYFKKLEEVVEAFNENGYPLEIVGPFSDSTRAECLRKNAKTNIVIEDKVLTYSEYYSKIGEARYSILPYDEQQYTGRTSGVLLESIFLDTIPIVPKEVFKDASKVGYQYESFEEIGYLLESGSDVEKLENIRWEKNEKYSKDMRKEKLLALLERKCQY